jgi:putative ABC transport system ATP-binding protein
LIDNLTLEENILLPALLDGKKKKDVMQRAEELMETVGILKRRHHTPRTIRWRTAAHGDCQGIDQ